MEDRFILYGLLWVLRFLFYSAGEVLKLGGLRFFYAMSDLIYVLQFPDSRRLMGREGRMETPWKSWRELGTSE